MIRKRVSYRTGIVPAIGIVENKPKPYNFRGKPSVLGDPRRWEFPLEGTGEFDISGQFYVPSTTEVDKPIKEGFFRRRVSEAVGFFSHAFGGSTQLLGFGNYRLGNKNVAEPVAIIQFSTTSETWMRYDLAIRRWIKKKKNSWDQKALTFVINGKMYFL